MIKEFESGDYPRLDAWYRARKMDRLEIWQLPEIGFINEAAACFLMRADGGVCFIDCLISDPGCPSEKRDHCIDEVVMCCLEKTRGFRICYALTNQESVIKRAELHGFKLNGKYTMLQRSS